MRHKLLAAILLYFSACMCVQAQQLVVTVPLTELSTHATARSNYRVDFNRDTCALLIIDIDIAKGITFEGDIIERRHTDNGWWLWLAPGAGWLTVTVEHYEPLQLNFDPMHQATTYSLSVARSDTRILMVTQPLHIDGDGRVEPKFRQTTRDGRECALLRMGLHDDDAVVEGSEGMVVAKSFHRGEWWLWLDPHARQLKVTLPGYEPLWLQIDTLCESTSYRVGISPRKSGWRWGKSRRTR